MDGSFNRACPRWLPHWKRDQCPVDRESHARELGQLPLAERVIEGGEGGDVGCYRYRLASLQLLPRNHRATSSPLYR